MSGNMSLSQTLGGLRIANPDQDSASPSPPPTISDPDGPTHGATSSPHSSARTVTDKNKTSFLPTLGSQDQPTSLGSLGFNPESFNTSSTAAQYLSSSNNGERQLHEAQISPRQPDPTSHQVHSPLQRSPAPASAAGPARAVYPQHTPSNSRPLSSMYNHKNASSSSAISIQGNNYRYTDEPPASTSSASVVRSGSRGGNIILQSAATPARVSSRSERSYRQIPGVTGPPGSRRGSRRGHSTDMGIGSPPMNNILATPLSGIEGPLPHSNEEWKDKGAAVSIRQELDGEGNPVTRVLKKGVNDFQFGRTLGEGSYSTVLAAADRQTGREFAIKVLDKRHIIKEKKVKYVNIEKDTLNRLTEHPGIVRLYYTFQDKTSLYFVLDLAGGGELLGFLKKMTTFDVECTQFYSAQILDAIDYMHSRGVIHRDLKPENVLLDDKMHVKITDFGTAKILEVSRAVNGEGSTAGDPLDGADTDRAVSFVGTAEYVSPELLTEKNACKASDLWAFGCIVYQLLAGRPPFKASNEYQTFQKIVGLDYTFPDGFPPIARDLVERLLVLDPAKRLPIEHIKNHQFFDSVKWGKGLWKQKAPRLKSFVPPPHEPIRLNGPSATPQSSSQARPQPRVITELPPPSQLDIEWSPVLNKTNERILKLGNLFVTTAPAPHSPNSKGDSTEAPRKFAIFFGGNTQKRRQRLVMITSSARVIMAAAGGNEKKTKLEVSLFSPSCSWKSFEDSKGLTVWCIDTKDKHIVFEDPKATPSDPAGSRFSANEWLEAVEQAKEIAMSQSLSNSYSGESVLNDLSSAISSPSSTAGVDPTIDGVNIPSSRHYRKDDNESIKGRKRFSKRHSKNGLAAVF